MNQVLKYPVGTQVRHKRTGGVYVITGFARYVENLEVLYLYEPIDEKARTGMPWSRRSVQMEDGRFELMQ